MNMLVTCNNPELVNLLKIVKKVLSFIQIAGPILCIIGLIIFIINMAINPEDKKIVKKIFNSVFALVIVFVIPILVNAVMLLVDENTTISSCWKEEASEESDWEYIETDEDRSDIIVNSDEYKSDS